MFGFQKLTVYQEARTLVKDISYFGKISHA